jgi:transposase
VLGALHAITHQLITMTNDSYINATSVCELLEKIAALGLQTPITLVMDNVRSQRCRLVLERASQLGIELLFLPPYSPNLNLIERLWRGRSAKNVSTTTTMSTLNRSIKPSRSVWQKRQAATKPSSIVC